MSMRLLIALGSLAALGNASNPASGKVVTPTTCVGVKDFYKTNHCCGNPTKTIKIAEKCGSDKPKCAGAEPQAPRDLSAGATGLKVPKASVLTLAQTKSLPIANVHFHLGAEHKSDAYNVDTDSKAYDAANAGHGRRLSGNPRPGWMCSEASLTADEKTAYTFQHCTGTLTVGKSYEVHYVHSSAGWGAQAALEAHEDLMDDGLGEAAGAVRLQLNPMVTVQAQVFQLVNAANSPTTNDMLTGWTATSGPTFTLANHPNSVMYTGSTTGPSHTNEICSPYIVAWHVDKACYKIAAATFDNFCKQMKDLYALSADLAPHGSRILVDPKYVVPAPNVVPLA